jgi:hypothetical protein
MWDSMSLPELREALAEIESFAARCPDGPGCEGCSFERDEVLGLIAEKG